MSIFAKTLIRISILFEQEIEAGSVVIPRAYRISN